jgi:hypothetical protein
MFRFMNSLGLVGSKRKCVFVCHRRRVGGRGTGAYGRVWERVRGKSLESYRPPMLFDESCRLYSVLVAVPPAPPTYDRRRRIGSPL